ncbi:MAG TPA: response regulator [Candidatus Saccharimonadales bacterium]|jgi:two-component system response regulator/two-component system chemotaxis response regulator CheY
MKSTKRILIIEDEQPLREAFALLLTSEGYEVAVAENGKVGLDKLSTFTPDVVLLDLLMPVMNGVEFLKAVNKRRRAKPRYKTLVLSNLSDPMTHEDIEGYRVAGVAMKADLSPTELADIVKNLAGN